MSETTREKVYGGVVPALEAQIESLRSDVEVERGHAEAARADVNALRVRNREAAGRIDRLEAEVARLRSVEEGLKSERVRADHLAALLHAQDTELERLRVQIARARV